MTDHTHKKCPILYELEDAGRYRCPLVAYCTRQDKDVCPMCMRMEQVAVMA